MSEARPLSIRLSRDEDGPALGRLFAESAYDDHGVDWSRPLGAWWLLAEDPATGQLVGALQTIVSRPFGHIGELLVHPSRRGRRGDGSGALNGIALGRVAMLLIAVAWDLMAKAGVQIVRGTVDPVTRRGLVKCYERHGAVDLGTYSLMARRVA